MDLVTTAKQIASRVHSGQHRRDGYTPYINHVAAVAAKLSNEPAEVVAAAWLHDVLEDSETTYDDLVHAGIPKEVAHAVVVLTHMPDEPYENYLRQIRENPIARKVKIADMLHNLGDAPTEQQIIKYAKGLLALCANTPSRAARSVRSGDSFGRFRSESKSPRFSPLSDGASGD